MIPLRCIMDDVKILMDAAVVRLPASIKELRQILVAQLHREHTILDRGKSSKAPHSLSTIAAAERINHGATTSNIQDYSLLLESSSPLLPSKPKRSILARNPDGHIYVHKPEGHICTTCGRSYTRKEHLKRHERNHAQGDPLKCSQCTRTFHRRHLLERHEARHHESPSAETNREDMRDPKKNGQPRQDNGDSILDRLGNYSPATESPPLTPDVLTDDTPWPLGSLTEVVSVEEYDEHGFPVSLDEAPEAKKPRTEAPWTPKEDLCLKRMRSEGASWNKIMEIFSDKPESSVKKHWYKDLHREGMAEDASASASVPEQGE
jgi:hypothetical protein